MENQVTVRAARAEDREAIIAFCQSTFSWGDYIADVWDAWLTDVSGQMFVGSVANCPVGLMHVALIDGIAWMEGMRVHPDFRRQGIGRAIEQVGREFARSHGCRVARLATSIKNLAAQRLLHTLGYRRVAQFNEWEAEPRRNDFCAARVAAESDLPEIFARWRGSAAGIASHAVVPTRRWRWMELNEARLREHIHANEVRTVPHGFALLLAFDEKDWNRLALHALGGDEEAAYVLALAARGEAEYRGYSHLEAILGNHPALNVALERAGFTREGGMLIYEQELG